MANLWTGTINTNGEYATLASKTGLTFTSGTKYTIQVQNAAYVREGTTGEGFYVDNDIPFDYTAGDDDLYIKTPNFQCVVNIAS